MSGFALRHGEAVAIGLAIDSVYSTLGPRPAPARGRPHPRLPLDPGVRARPPDARDAELLLDGLEEFRQHLGGRLTVTMLRGIGDPIDAHDVDRALMREAIRHVASYGAPGREAAPRAEASGHRRDTPVGSKGRHR
jgi:3-dehydroquinate synthase